MKRLAIMLLLLASCGEEDSTLPDPVHLTEAAIGHYCRMMVVDHEGPKAQIHLKGEAEPLYFVQVRDSLAYAKGPERHADLRAIYVSDMGVAPGWADPGADNWILAQDAHFVVGGDVRGGMGVPEIVPFSSAEAASRFTDRHGGTVLAFADIPDLAVLAPVDTGLAHSTGHKH